MDQARVAKKIFESKAESKRKMGRLQDVENDLRVTKGIKL
jgi:hypothetical protein